jgi:hypothetical protein
VDAWIRTRWLSLSGGVDFSFLVRYVFQKTDGNKRINNCSSNCLCLVADY